MIAQRLTETLAMLMIGDGVLAVIEPRHHLRLWLDGPPWWRGMVEPFLERPHLARGLGVAEVALGVWLAHSQAEPDPEHPGLA